MSAEGTGTAIHYLGHAGFIVSHRGARLLIDPWFYPAFLESWFPYPDNRHLLAEVLAGDYDAMYISHTHEDHFDEKVLEHLDRDVQVIVPRYRSKVMARKLSGLGFRNLVLLGHGEEHKLADGFSVTMLLDTSHKEDSGLLVELDEFRFLDLNDCNPKLSDLPADIDLLAAQHSGAMWYPNCYSYPADVMAEKVSTVRRGLMESLVKKVQLTGARAYLPSAGPPCFLDPALEQYNDRSSTIFPAWEDVDSDFASQCPDVNVLVVAPGDSIAGLEVGTAIHVTSGGVNQPADPAEYIASYRERRRDEWEAYFTRPDHQVTAADLEEYFRRLQRWNARFLEDYRKDIRLVTDGTHWGIRLGRLAEQFIFEDDPIDPDYTIYVPPRILRAVIAGEVGWEEALLSMRLSLHRVPDVFDLMLMGLLRYGEHPAQTMQLVRERHNTATIERDGLRMQQFCPHAGEDLTYALICDGIIECPRHHWKWDVRTGECIEGGAVPLRVTQAAAEAQP